MNSAVFQTPQGTKVKQIAEVLSPLLVDTGLSFKKKALEIAGVGPDIQLKLVLRPSNSDIYMIPKEEIFTGIDFKKLNLLLRAVNFGDMLALELPVGYDGAMTPELIMKHWNDQKVSEFGIPLLDIPNLPRMDEDDLDFQYVRLNPVILHNEIKFLARLGDKVTVASPSAKEIVFKIIGGGRGVTAIPASSSFPWDEASAYKGGIVTYSVKILRLVTKAHAFATGCQIGQNRTGTLRFIYQIGTGGNLVFIIQGEKQIQVKKQKLKPQAVPQICSLCSNVILVDERYGLDHNGAHCHERCLSSV